MKEKITYSFSFTVDGLEFNFNIVAETRKEALEILKAKLGFILAEVNMRI